MWEELSLAPRGRRVPLSTRGSGKAVQSLNSNQSESKI